MPFGDAATGSASGFRGPGGRTYVDGVPYDDPAAADAAAQSAQSRQQSVTPTPAPASYSGLVGATGGETAPAQTPVYNPMLSMPGSSSPVYTTGKNPAGEFVNNPNGGVPLPTDLAVSDSVKQGDMKYQAQLQADAEARRLGYLSKVTGANPQVGGGAPAYDETAARAAAFARAKEQAGGTALASLRALQEVMANSGKMGSSQEAQGEEAIAGGAAGSVNDFTREQLMQDLNRAAQVGDRNYQGAITQRGQNLSMVPSLMGLITASNGVGAY